jgi:cellulose synthase/poly-beta-1,6-N-acetylglucosamine synthase-like glycosyltransferase
VDDTNQNTDQIPELKLSVIVPARNEEQSLPACLTSLVEQSEVGFALGLEWEIIVVNDDSTDRTREIAVGVAASHPGITVLDAPPLDLSSRGGFTGKNAACWAAAQIARGRHLLFTDADTVHERHNLSHALWEAEKHKAVLLSYSPRQIVSGFWQHAVMPLVFSELASVYPSKEVNDPQRRLAAANGQFLMVERDAYFSVGGHRAVGSMVLEDVALAHNIKRGPRVIRFRYAPEALSTRMYRTTTEMVEGWTKNLALLLPSPLYLACWRVLDVLLFFGLPALAFGIPWLVGWQRGVILILWVRTLWRFYARVARSNFPARDIAISILGIPLFVYLLVRSVIYHRVKKSVIWKGRSYNTTR